MIDARLRQVGVAREALAWATGEELDETAFWRAKRGGANTREALLRLGYSRPLAGRVAERWGERIEAEDWVSRDRALPGARQVLNALGRDGVAITVLTARRCVQGARGSLRAAGLEALIDELLVVEPTRAVAEKTTALRCCGAMAFVGDTESDGAACAAAGLPFAAVATGQRSASYLRRAGFEPSGSLSAAVRSLAP